LSSYHDKGSRGAIKMSGLKLSQINKVFPNGRHPVKHLDLDIQEKELMVILGPATCGKSVLLRMIAGLEDISEGDLFYMGERLNEKSPIEREITFMLDQYAIYPHLTVYDNVAFGLKLKKKSKEAIDKDVRDALHALEIEHLSDKTPGEISLIELQKVSLARAVVRKPKVFIIDEPFFNLDIEVKNQMIEELKKLHKRIDTIFIYATGNPRDAKRFDDSRICILFRGRIQQVGKYEELYRAPVNNFVAGYIGEPQMSFIDIILKKEDNRYFGQLESQRIEISNQFVDKMSMDAFVGKKLILGFRPDHVHTVKRQDDQSLLKGWVIAKEMHDDDAVWTINVDNQHIMSTHFDNSIKVNEEVTLKIDFDVAYVFDKLSEKALSYKE